MPELRIEMSGCFRSKSNNQPDPEEEEDDADDNQIASTSFQRSDAKRSHAKTNGVHLVGSYLPRESYRNKSFPESYNNPSYNPDAEDDYDQITVLNTQVSVIESSYQFTPDPTPCPIHQFKLNGSCPCQNGQAMEAIPNGRSHFRNVITELDRYHDRRPLKVIEYPLVYLTPESVKKVTKSYSSLI